MVLEESRILPIICTMPFTVDTWPKYLLAYGWMNMTYGTLILLKLAIVAIQTALGFYSMAAMQNLRAR